MTEKEIEKMGIFITKDDAYIAGTLKDNKPSKNKRKLDEGEILNLVMWFIDKKCLELQVTDFTINVKDKPTYKLENLAFAEASKAALEAKQKEENQN